MSLKDKFAVALLVISAGTFAESAFAFLASCSDECYHPNCYGWTEITNDVVCIKKAVPWIAKQSHWHFRTVR
jgi:hypothetical protein